MDHEYYFTQGDIDEGAYEVLTRETYVLWTEGEALRGLRFSLVAEGDGDQPPPRGVRLDGAGHVTARPGQTHTLAEALERFRL